MYAGVPELFGNVTSRCNSLGVFVNANRPRTPRPLTKFEGVGWHFGDNPVCEGCGGYLNGSSRRVPATEEANFGVAGSTRS